MQIYALKNKSYTISAWLRSFILSTSLCGFVSISYAYAEDTQNNTTQNNTAESDQNQNSQEQNNTSQNTDEHAMKASDIDLLDNKDSESIAERKRIIDAAQIRIQQKTAKADQSISDEQDTIEPKKIISPDSLEHLLRIYEQMKPAEAAGLFNVMDKHMLISLAANMNTRKLAAILAKMEPDRVNLVTQYVVGVKHFHHQDAMKSLFISQSSEDNVNLNASFEKRGSLLPSRQ